MRWSYGLKNFAVLSPSPINNENGVVAYCPLSDGTATDFSGNQNNCTLSGSVPPKVSGIASPVGNAMLFDGTNSYINLGTATNLNPPSMTFCCWCYFNSLANAYTAVMSKVGGSGAFQLFVKSTGKLACYLAAPGIVSYDGSGANTLTTAKWYHLGFTYVAGSGLTIGTVNGLLDGTLSAAGGLTTNTGETDIGRDQGTGGRFMNGLIADARVYNRGLSVDELFWICNQGLGYGEDLEEMPAVSTAAAAAGFQSYLIRSNSVLGTGTI